MKVELMYSFVELSVNKAVSDLASLEKPCYMFFWVVMNLNICLRNFIKMRLRYA